MGHHLRGLVEVEVEVSLVVVGIESVRMYLLWLGVRRQPVGIEALVIGHLVGSRMWVVGKCRGPRLSICRRVTGGALGWIARMCHGRRSSWLLCKYPLAVRVSTRGLGSRSPTHSLRAADPTLEL